MWPRSCARQIASVSVSFSAERGGDRAGDLRHFHGVGEAGAVQVAFVIDEHLGLVDQAPEGVGMDDAIAVALEFAAELAASVPGNGGRGTAPSCAA